MGRFAFVGLSVFLAGCSSVGTGGVPEDNLDIYPELVDANQSEIILAYRWQPDPYPRGEIHSVNGNSEYYVNEQTYMVWEKTDDYVSTGIASWRGDEFEDRITVSGENFDNSGLQAAHRYLKIPCWVEVTNLLTNKKAVVRINDRGPFHGDYDLDLSRGAAEKLGFGDRLTAPVKIELVDAVPQYFIETNMVYGLPAAQQLLELVNQLSGITGRIMPHQYENRFRVEIGPIYSLEDSRFVQNWLVETAEMQSTLLKR